MAALGGLVKSKEQRKDRAMRMWPRAQLALNNGSVLLGVQQWW